MKKIVMYANENKKNATPETEFDRFRIKEKRHIKSFLMSGGFYIVGVLLSAIRLLLFGDMDWYLMVPFLASFIMAFDSRLAVGRRREIPWLEKKLITHSFLVASINLVTLAMFFLTPLPLLFLPFVAIVFYLY